MKLTLRYLVDLKGADCNLLGWLRKVTIIYLNYLEKELDCNLLGSLRKRNAIYWIDLEKVVLFT